MRAQGLPLTLSHAVSSAEKREQFLSIWPSLSDELVEYAKGEKMPKDAVEWFKRVRLVFRDPGRAALGSRSLGSFNSTSNR